MLRLLRIEWLKIKHYRAFWIFSILYFVSIAGINYVGYYLNEQVRTNLPGSETMLGSPFGFPRVWATVGFMSSWLLYLPGILFILLLTNEFTFKTHRQNILDGWERRDFINVKFVSIIIYSLLATLLNALTAIVAGLSMPGSHFSFTGFYHVGYIFLQTLSYIGFATFLAIIFRRSGVAIAVFFLYGLVFESLFQGLFFRFDLSTLGYFLPLQVTDTLLPIPFGKDFLYRNVPEHWILLAAAIIYLLIYYFLAMNKFERDDL